MLRGTMSELEPDLPVNPAVNAAARGRLFAIAARVATVRGLVTKPYLDVIETIQNRDWRLFARHSVADTAFLHGLILSLLQQFDTVATAARPFTVCQAPRALSTDQRCGTCDGCRLAHALEAPR